MSTIKNAINKRFPITDKGPIEFFLNIHFIRDRAAKTMQLHQKSKIDKVIAEFLPNGLPSKIPAFTNTVLTSEMCPVELKDKLDITQYPYLRLVGILLHIAITARPDILPAVSQAGRYVCGLYE
jgi:hypothetical protein